jgi:hypothetical protein
MSQHMRRERSQLRAAGRLSAAMTTEPLPPQGVGHGRRGTKPSDAECETWVPLPAVCMRADARLVITAVVIEERPVAEVAAGDRISWSWIYELVARHLAEGDPAFEPRSRRPARHRTRPLSTWWI